MSIGIVVAGFILLYMYDFNSIGTRYLIAQKFFFCGSVCIVCGTAYQMMVDYFHVVWEIRMVICVVCFIISLSLLIYTLFFALPFDDTYRGDSCYICDTGVYALCRHPGVICFLMVYASLYGIYGSVGILRLGVVANLLNFIYIILQDTLIFPKTFSGYSDYQKHVPFLVPNINSIRRCIDTIRG